MADRKGWNRIARTFACALMLAVAASVAHAAEPPADPWAPLQRGLRPNVLRADAPLPHWSLEARMRHHQVPGVGIALVRDGRITCAVHGASFVVSSGECCGGPARSGLVGMPVEVIDGVVRLGRAES